MAELIKSEALLDKKIASCVDCLEKKYSGKDGKRHVVVCGGTGCLSSDSQLILDKLQDAIKEKGLSDKVDANIVGCFGFCSQGPFVKIYPEDTLYHAVKVSDVDKIVEQDLINHQVVNELLYEDPNTHKKIQKQDDIAFYAKQERIVLATSGRINPENLDEAFGTHSFEIYKYPCRQSENIGYHILSVQDVRTDYHLCCFGRSNQGWHFRHYLLPTYRLCSVKPHTSHSACLL